MFQSYSKGDEQRIVLGVGLNTEMDRLGVGQGSLAQLKVASSNTELFAMLNAVIASIFENKHPALETHNQQMIFHDVVLQDCIYRNKVCSLSSVESTTITLVDEAGKCFTVDDDDQIEWVNLHPQ